MTDIVERLRDPEQGLTSSDRYHLHKDAADEIERLRERYDFQVAASRSLVEACAKSEDENERLKHDLAEADALIAAHAHAIDPSSPLNWPSGSHLVKAIKRHTARGAR